MIPAVNENAFINVNVNLSKLRINIKRTVRTFVIKITEDKTSNSLLLGAGYRDLNYFFKSMDCQLRTLSYISM